MIKYLCIKEGRKKKKFFLLFDNKVISRKVSKKKQFSPMAEVCMVTLHILHIRNQCVTYLVFVTFSVLGVRSRVTSEISQLTTHYAVRMTIQITRLIPITLFYLDEIYLNINVPMLTFQIQG